MMKLYFYLTDFSEMATLLEKKTHEQYSKVYFISSIKHRAC